MQAPQSMQTLLSMYSIWSSPWKHATGHTVTQSVKRHLSQLPVTMVGMSLLYPAKMWPSAHMAMRDEKSARIRTGNARGRIMDKDISVRMFDRHRHGALSHRCGNGPRARGVGGAERGSRGRARLFRGSGYPRARAPVPLCGPRLRLRLRGPDRLAGAARSRAPALRQRAFGGCRREGCATLPSPARSLGHPLSRDALHGPPPPPKPAPPALPPPVGW